jgi:hypothetical protein
MGDWKAVAEATRQATKLGENSIGALDYGLYAYVNLPLSYLTHVRETARMRLENLEILTDIKILPQR